MRGTHSCERVQNGSISRDHGCSGRGTLVSPKKDFLSKTEKQGPGKDVAGVTVQAEARSTGVRTT